MKLRIPPGKLCSSLKSQARRVLYGAGLALLTLNMTGCSILSKPLPPECPVLPLEPCAKEQREIARLQKLLLVEKELHQQEIERMQKLLTEKEAQLRSQQVLQQDQAKTLERTTSQAAHAQVKLRRLATRPAAASTIAEVEVAMEGVKSQLSLESELAVYNQAQRLLDAAVSSFAEHNYVAAMDYAALANGFIDMMKNNRTFKPTDPPRAPTPFAIPIPLHVTVNSNLRQKPGLSARILGVLRKNSLVTAEAYRGDWLQVQTADGRSGWVLNTLVEAQAGKP